MPRVLAAVVLSFTLAAAAGTSGSGGRRQSVPEPPAPTDRITRLKDLRLTTVLCRNGQAEAVIAIPDGEVYRNLASEINARVKACSGVELPVVVNETPEGLLSRGHVLALGCLADNPFIEQLYFRWLCFTDRWYPGTGGYEIRSIHDPLGTGANVILLGGSDPAGVAAAVRKFCGRLEPAPRGPLSVGWLLDVRLGPDHEPPADLSTAPPLLRLFVEGLEMPLGYNEASRLGLMYYYSGDPRFAAAFLQSARANRLLSRADHYHAHHNALVWDLIEESPLFTDADRLFVTNEILEHARSGESGGGLAALAGGPEAMFDRHAGFIGLSALTDVRYLARDYPRRQWPEILASVDAYFRPRLGSYASGSDLARGIYTYLEALVIYSLLTGDGTLARSGALRAWAGRCAALCDPQGFLVPSGQYDERSYPYFTFRKAAYLLKDPGFLYLAEARRRAGKSQGVYELGMEYDQGQAFAGDLEPGPPEGLAGVRVIPLDDRERREFDPGLPPDKAFAKITFRSGAGEHDQFLVLDGIWGGPPEKPIQDANAILQYSEGGRTYLLTLDPETRNRRSSSVNHNILSVTRDGQAPVPPRLAALEAAADLPSIGYTETCLDPYLDGSWSRRIFWRKGAYFLALDVFRAGRTGTFALESQWRLLGRPEITADGFESALETGGAGDRTGSTIVFRTAPLAEEKGAVSAWPVRRSEIDLSSDPARRQYHRYAPPLLNRLRPAAVLALGEGEKAGLAALFYTTSPDRPRDYSLAAAGPGSFLILGDEPAWLGLPQAGSRLARGPLEADADCLWATKTSIAAARLTRLKLDGRDVVSAAVPVDLEWDFRSGTCALSLNRPAVVEVASRGLLKLGPGEHVLTGLPIPGEAAAGRLARIFDPPAPLPAAPPDAALRPALDAPDLLAAPEPWPEAPVLALKVDDGGEAEAVLLGCADGRIIRSDRRGRTYWEFATGGPVWAVETARLGSGVKAVLAGSDDEHLYALDFETGRRLWAHRAEVYPETSIYPWWTLEGRAKVRSVLAADFDGDGGAEIAIGTGGMQVEMVGADGLLKWRQPVRYGLPVRLLALDPPSGGPPALLAGLDFLASQSGVFRFRGDGLLETSDAFSSGRRGWDYTGISAWAVTASSGPKDAILAVGRSGAFHEIEFYDLPGGRSLGKARVGEAVTGLIWAEGGPEILAVAGTEAGWVMAIRPDGRVAWSRPLPGPVARLWLTGEGTIAAWCPEGAYFILDRLGRVQARGRASWPAAVMATGGN